MPAKILDSQLQLTVSDGNAKPDVFIKQPNLAVKEKGDIIFHLTHGFAGPGFPIGQSAALTAGAHVPLTGGLGGTSFGFVQIMRGNFFGAFYAGRIPREGSVGVTAHNPPAMANPVSLDQRPGISIPFYDDPSFSSFAGSTVNTTWGDHPAEKIPLTMTNTFAGNIDNFLFQFIDDSEFWTIFTAQDPGGALRYIAHFHWQVRYDFEFMWRNAQVSVRRSKSSVKVLERKVKGRPTEGDIQGLLSTPAGPPTNTLAEKAMLAAFLGGRGPNRSENTERFRNVPADFWA